MPLSNKNRSKKAKQMKRDEGGRHVHFSLIAMHVPSRAPSHLSSFTLTIIAQNDNCSMVYERSDRIFICMKGKAKECLGANIIFTSSIFCFNYMVSSITAYMDECCFLIPLYFESLQPF